MTTIYTVTTVIGVEDNADEHLRTVEAVKGEVGSWLEGLGADIRALVVGTLPPPDGLSPEDLAAHQYRFMRVMERGQQKQKGVLAAWLAGKPLVVLDGQQGAVSIIALCLRAATQAGWTPERIEAVRAELSAVITGGDHDRLLAAAMQHFEVRR